MDNPFDTIEISSKPRIKRTFKLNEMLEFFPEESSNSIALKHKILQKVKTHKPELSDFKLFKITQMFFNKYFYKLRYFDEHLIDKFISSTEEFELFKTI